MVIWYTLTGITGCLFLASFALYLHAQKSFRRQQSDPSFSQTFFSRKSPQKHFRIGILTTIANSSAVHLQQGIVQQLDASSQATYTVSSFHGNNDRVTLFNQAVLALDKCDLVIPFGLACTNIAYEAARHHKSSTPIIFSGIKSNHIALLRRQNHVEKLIGVISQRDYVTQLNQLHAIKPTMKNILILYRQQFEWLIAQVDEMTDYLATLNIVAHKHLLPHGTHIDNQLGTLSHQFDTIILMPQTLNAKGIQELVTYCNIKGITLCANELDAVTLGAAIGFGGEEVMIGTRVGRTIRDALEIKKELHEDTIIKHIDHYQVHLNSRTLEQQDIYLAPEILFLLNQGEITHATPTTPATVPTLSPVGAHVAMGVNQTPTSTPKLISSWRQVL